MGGEFKRFILVWTSAILALSYSFYTSKKMPRGFTRLISLLPVVVLFFLVPLHLSTVHLCGITALFLSWLANFKLLLLAFGTGPLSHPSLGLVRFIFVACVPVQMAALAFLFESYEYTESLSRIVVFALYCLHLYIELDFILALTATVVRGVTGLEIQPQIDAPYLATSLQDFWGRRWNLMVPSILRPTVYNPVRRASERLIGGEWGRLVGLLSAFAVSGIMHELMYYYISRVAPTWEVTWFFVLQGVCTALEVAVKKTEAVASGRWRLPRAVSGPLTVGFVGSTAVWLFLHQALRDGMVEKAIKEGLVVGNYVKNFAPLT